MNFLKKVGLSFLGLCAALLLLVVLVAVCILWLVGAIVTAVAGCIFGVILLLQFGLTATITLVSGTLAAIADAIKSVQ